MAARGLNHKLYTSWESAAGTLRTKTCVSSLSETDLEVNRKTGVALSNTGEVDEHGMLPLDNVWSSPAKADAPAHDDEDDDDDDDTGSEEMELADPSSVFYLVRA